MKKLLLHIAFMLFAFSIGISCNEEDEPCIEDIQEDCMCTMIYKPVCGCNEKTYGNACVAECTGITEYTPGECK